jgi:hypothetical protein
MEGQEKILYDMAVSTVEMALFNPSRCAAHAQLYAASGMMGALGVLIRSRLQEECSDIDPDLLAEFQGEDYIKLNSRCQWVAYQIGA